MIHMIFKKQKTSWEYECSEINRKMMIMGKAIDSIGNISAFSGQFPVMHQVMLKILRPKFCGEYHNVATIDISTKNRILKKKYKPSRRQMTSIYKLLYI